MTGLKESKFRNVVVFTGPDIGVPDFKSDKSLAYLQKEFLSDYKLPAPQSIFDLEFYKKKPEAFTKFAKEFLIHEDSDGVFLNQPKLSHKLVKYLSDKNLLYRYFTSNIENSEEQLLPKKRTVHAYGAMKIFEDDQFNSQSCVKCGKEEKTYKLLASLQGNSVLRCRADIKQDEIFNEV